MSNTSYSKFDDQSADEKDKLCDKNGEIIMDMIISRNIEQNQCINYNLNQNMDKNNSNNKKSNNLFKRQLTSSSQYGDNEIIINNDEIISNENNINPFITVTKKNRQKQQKTSDNELIGVNNNNETDMSNKYSQHTSTKNNSRLFVNSKRKENYNYYMHTRNELYDISHQQYSEGRKDINSSEPYDDESYKNDDSLINQNNNINNHNKNNKNFNKIQNKEIIISQHALDFAVEQHLPPIHINCSPKLENHLKGKEIVKALFEYIEKHFRKINKHYKLPLGFEYWFINKNGDLTCFTKLSNISFINNDYSSTTQTSS